MEHAHRITRRLLALYAAAISLSACTSHRATDEHVGEARAALSGGAADVNTSDANVVVEVSCSGILITPRIVLTASHCIWGSDDNGCNATAVVASAGVGVQGTIGSVLGPRFAPHSAHPYEAKIDRCGDYTPITGNADPSSDIALIYLAQPITQASMAALFPNSGVAVPRVVRPKLETPPDDNGVYPWVLGSAGWGGVHTARQVLELTDARYDNYDTSPDWRWEKRVDRWDIEKGDSGGPLYVRGLDGNRDVIGIAHGHREDIFERIMIWADVTHERNKSWIIDRVEEASAPTELRHSLAWLASHGKTGHDWWGELDYSGPCDLEHDRDCDGWWDHNADAQHPIHDNCPFVPNPSQEDARDRGWGDACLACPYDPDNDEDGDGVCNGCPPWNPGCHKDNCPKIANPSQANCNLEAERGWNKRHSSQPVPELGDACDPVPCPLANAEAVVDRSLVLGACDRHPYSPTLCVGREIRNRIDAAPVGASKRETAFVAPRTFAVPDVPTHARFCQSNPDDSFDCTDGFKQSELELTAYGSARAERFDRQHIWHRVTLGNACKTARGSGCVSRPVRGEPFFMNYGAEQKSIGWQYENDYSFYTDTSINALAPIIPSPINLGCQDYARYGQGTCLDGRLWLSGETPVGGTSDTAPGGNVVGLHGIELANHFFEAAPDAPFSRVGGGFRAERFFFLWRTLPDPPPFRFDVGAALPIIAEENELFAVFESGLRESVTARFDTGLRTKVLDPALRWVWSAEASPFAGDSSRPIAIALASDSTSVVTQAYSFDGTLFETFPTGGCEINSDSCAFASAQRPHGASRTLATPDGPPARADSFAIYTQAHGGVYVLGGRDASGQVMRDAWFYSLELGAWTRLPVADGAIGEVIGATYSYRQRRLWILDRDPNDRSGSPQIRLLRIDPYLGSIEVVTMPGSLRSAPKYEDHGLMVDLDGRVIIYASSERAQKHRMARLDPKGGGGFDVGLTKRRDRALSAPPFADLRGFVLYYQPDRPPIDPARGPDDDPVPSDRTVAGTRLSELPLRAGNLQQLADLLR